MTAKTFNTILSWIKTYQTGAEQEDYSHFLSSFENENSKIIIQNENYIVVVKLGQLVRKSQYRILSGHIRQKKCFSGSRSYVSNARHLYFLRLE